MLRVAFSSSQEGFFSRSGNCGRKSYTAICVDVEGEERGSSVRIEGFEMR